MTNVASTSPIITSTVPGSQPVTRPQTAPPVSGGNASISTGFGAAVDPEVEGGGSVADTLSGALQRITGFAERSMTSITKNMNDSIKKIESEGGDPAIGAAKMQMYNAQLVGSNQLNEMAAKIQQKQDEQVRVWLQR